LIYKKKIKDKMSARWKEGHKIIDYVQPDAYIVSDGKKRYRLNKAHVKKDHALN
jgi:hypothetical protein